MRRILDYIAKYDESLTIEQLKKAIINEQESAKEKELDEIKLVKEKFENTYLKEIYNCDLFGKTLKIYSFKGLVRHEKNTDWEFIYYFKSNKISFREGGISYTEFRPDRSGNGFTIEELNTMQIITEKEFNDYQLKYAEIFNKINTVIDYVY